MAIYFGNDPTKGANIIYYPSANITLSCDVSSYIGSTYSNFWFVLSSNGLNGSGVIVGPVGPTFDNPYQNWNGHFNHAVVTNNIAQTTFSYYPSNQTTDAESGNTYNPIAVNYNTYIFLYGANNSYSNVTKLFSQSFLSLPAGNTWGIVGFATGWGAQPDIVMNESNVGSGIFYGRLPYVAGLTSNECKFRYNSSLSYNYGSNGATDLSSGPLIANSTNNIQTQLLSDTEYYNIIMDLNNLTYSATLGFPCFKEDTKILTNKGYVPIQDLRKGDLVKTLCHDYLPIDMIGKREIYHPASQERITDQLYKCSQSEYPELFEPLILTGCHSILVDNFTCEEQKQKVIDINGDLFTTDDKYRLVACADERAIVYEKPGNYTIYHLALENDNYYWNYGIYANGLLVETCSKRYLKELSNMIII